MWPLPSIELTKKERERFDRIILTEKMVPQFTEFLKDFSDDDIKKLEGTFRFAYSNDLSPLELLGAYWRYHGKPLVNARLPNSEDRIISMIINKEIVEVEEE
jgi:hypothetical protein